MNLVDELVSGDIMRISVEMLKRLHELPTQSSLKVRVKYIELMDDGSKKLVIEAAE